MQLQEWYSEHKVIQSKCNVDAGSASSSGEKAELQASPICFANAAELLTALNSANSRKLKEQDELKDLFLTTKLKSLSINAFNPSASTFCLVQVINGSLESLRQQCKVFFFYFLCFYNGVSSSTTFGFIFVHPSASIFHTVWFSEKFRPFRLTANKERGLESP